MRNSRIILGLMLTVFSSISQASAPKQHVDEIKKGIELINESVDAMQKFYRTEKKKIDDNFKMVKEGSMLFFNNELRITFKRLLDKAQSEIDHMQNQVRERSSKFEGELSSFKKRLEELGTSEEVEQLKNQVETLKKKILKDWNKPHRTNEESASEL